MTDMRSFTLHVGAAALVLLSISAVRAEVLEEIVAKVNDDIITKTELEFEEQAMTAELYRTLSGAELDRTLQEARAQLLRRLIDRRILVQRAERLYDMEKLGQSMLDQFMAQQNIPDTKELERLLAQEGKTLEDLRRRLVEVYAPEEVVRYEVGGRIAVGDKEVETYYAAHPDDFVVPAEVTFREIVIRAPEDQREGRRADAEAARVRAVAPGADFAAVAKELSEVGTASAGGLIGPLKRSDVLEQLAEHAFRMSPGEVSPVIETQHGFHVLKLESRTEERRKTLDEVRESVREQLAQRRYETDVRAFLDRAWKEAAVWVNPKYAGRMQELPPPATAGSS